MGRIDRLLGNKARNDRESDRLPPEVRTVFDKVRHLLDNEASQNELYLPEMSAAIHAGADVDEIQSGLGDFGRDPSNPIPENGALGDLIYRSHLVAGTGARILGHRLGSKSSIDVCEVVSLDGTMWAILFFDLYHPRKSRRAPAGFRIEPGPWILATNYRLDDVPRSPKGSVARSTREFIGLPFVGPLLLDDQVFGSLSWRWYCSRTCVIMPARRSRWRSRGADGLVEEVSHEYRRTNREPVAVSREEHAR